MLPRQCRSQTTCAQYDHSACFFRLTFVFGEFSLPFLASAVVKNSLDLPAFAQQTNSSAAPSSVEAHAFWALLQLDALAEDAEMSQIVLFSVPGFNLISETINFSFIFFRFSLFSKLWRIVAVIPAPMLCLQCTFVLVCA
jgi:hypothetical protein